MKRFIATLVLGLSFCQFGFAGPTAPITPEFYVYGLLTTPPTVDEVSFYNNGIFKIDAVFGVSPTNLSSTLSAVGFNPLPFATKDTLYFTNTVSGLLQAYPGFRFDTATSTSRHSASYFVNQGTVKGLDVAASAVDALYSPPGSTAITIVPALGQPIPSEVIVNVTNIVNSGAISVGNAGTLSMVGSNINTAHGTLAAGVVGTVGITNYTDDLTGLQGWDGGFIVVGGPYFYVGSPEVYDLFWGVTNALTVDTAGFSDEVPYGIPNIFSGARQLGDDVAVSIPINLNPQFSTNAFLSIDGTGTNVYYNVVFVNTNFQNPNISATVGISAAEFLQYASLTVPADGNAFEDIVQIAEPVYDVLTGQTVTNGIYLIDDGGLLPSMSESLNASAVGPYRRPNAFELSTVTPVNWFDATLEAEAFTFPYISPLLYTAGFFDNNKQPLEISDYGAQIGRNPADFFGSFKSLEDTNSDAFFILEDLPVNLPDPTNEAGRVEMTAANLNLSQARLRAEGLVQIIATNLVGGGMSAVDWGEANVALGISNGTLVISNIFPSTFQRIRGNIYAKSVTWQNTQTNSFIAGGETFIATNQWHYHVLIVDQNLFGSFTSTERNLTLTGSNSVVVQDNLNVISKALINTTNLTLESSNFFGQNAENFTPATTPFLKNLFIATNGFLGTGNLLDVGFNQNQGLAAPGGRTYTVNSITNFGTMFSIAPLFQSAIFEHDGTIKATSGGSLLIEASNLYFGIALTNTTNSILADGSVSLSAITIQARNSVINTGLGEPSALMLNATAGLTDLVPGTATTNTNSVIINHWKVTDGFSLPGKPITGDLYGTEIHTIATNVQYVTHVWAGTDWSNNIANGWTDNEVIGRLVLDRQSSNAILHFAAAGIKNAMYVDFLEMTNYALSDYNTGLAIDPNFTIYFADSNLDPQKLHEIYPNLVWVTNFAGPNSTYVVPYTNSSVVCLMNAAVAMSGSIAFWDGIANLNFLQEFGPYLLNGPYGTNFMACPGTYSFPCNCTPGTNGYQLYYTNISTAGGITNVEVNVLTISSNGEGGISPTLKESQLVLGKSYSLKAVPAKGWVFDSWTLSILGNVITSYSNVLTFAFVSNTVVTANFIEIPFKTAAGVYSGLFYQTNAVLPGASGAVSITLAKTGSFSGKLVLGSTNYNFASIFSGAGAAQFKVGRGAGTLTVNLQLDITNDAGQIFGEISNNTFDAFLEANLAPVWTTKNPSPLAGSYTLSLPWSSGTEAAIEPGGDSYAVGTVSKLGVLTMSGALSDGAAFSASAPVSQGGLWPFYTYAASGKDSILGWVTVSNGLSSTNISWYKAPSHGAIYPAGFSNNLQLIGSLWVPPAKGAAVLSLTNPAVMVSGGDLPAALTFSASPLNSLTFEATNVNLTIKSATGGFSGWFEAPGTKKKTTFSGVVLTNDNSARGFFLGTDESGTVLLESQ